MTTFKTTIMDVNRKSFLSPKELGQAIGVSESSVKRWADDGALATAKTAGGHRRIAVAEAIRFIRDRRVPLVRPDLIGFPELSTRGMTASAESSEDRLFDALTANDSVAVRGLVLAAYVDGMPVASICDGPLRGAMARIGEMWRKSSRGIAIEHRATELCVQALHAIRSTLPDAPAAAPLALGGAAPGDPYVLPTLATAMTLASAGFRDQNLGPDLPYVALRDSIEHERPQLVWISVSSQASAAHVMRFAGELAAQLHVVGASLVVGGRALPQAELHKHANVHAFTSMCELLAFARGLAAARAPETSPAH